MLDTVRSTVLTLLNKNNFGSINVSDFNRMVKMAQLQVFTDYTKEYNELVNMQNAMMSGEGYADRLNIVQTNLENFIVYDETIESDGDGMLPLPSISTTGNSLYQLLEVKVYKGEKLYSIAEKVAIGTFSTMRMIDEPTAEFPIYSINGTRIMTYPSAGSCGPYLEWKIDFLRYPKEPKWTYNQFTGGAPIFNPSAPDFQDLEIGQDEFVKVVTLVCQYAGLVIREKDVVAYMAREEMQEEQKK